MKLTKYLLIFSLTAGLCTVPLSIETGAVSSGGSLVIFNEEEPESLIPLLNNSDSAKSVYNLIYSGLVNMDDNFDYFPDLAVSVPTLSNRGVEMTSEGMTVSYTIRDLAFWHDGKPITSDDVKFTWQCYTNPNIKKSDVENIDGYNKITKIETPDKKNLKIFFKEPYADYKKLFRYILPRHAFIPKTMSLINEKNPFNKMPIGSGPFMFVEWKSKNKMVLDTFKKYYKPLPHLDQVVFRYGKLDEKTISEFEKGKIHIIETKPKKDQESKVISPKAENYKIVQNFIEEIVFNTQSEALSDLNVRKALAHSINREKIAGEHASFQSIWSDSHPNSPIFEQAFKELYTYDLKLSAYYLDLAGWTVNREGIRKNSSDKTLTLKFLMTDSKIHNSTFKYLKEVLSYLGINVESKIVKESEIAEVAKDSTAYDIVLHSKPIAVNGTERINFFSSKSIPPYGNNYSRLNNQRLEAIFNDPERAADLREQKTVTSILSQEIPALPLFGYMHIISASSRLNNFRPNLVLGDTWNTSEWWLN